MALQIKRSKKLGKSFADAELLPGQLAYNYGKGELAIGSFSGTADDFSVIAGKKYVNMVSGLNETAIKKKSPLISGKFAQFDVDGDIIGVDIPDTGVLDVVDASQASYTFVDSSTGIAAIPISGLYSEIDDLNTKIDEITDEIDRLDDKIDDVDKKVDDLDDSLNQKIDDLDEKVETISGDVSGLTYDLEMSILTLGTLDTRVTDLENTDISGLINKGVLNGISEVITTNPDAFSGLIDITEYIKGKGKDAYDLLVSTFSGKADIKWVEDTFALSGHDHDDDYSKLDHTHVIPVSGVKLYSQSVVDSAGYANISGVLTSISGGTLLDGGTLEISGTLDNSNGIFTINTFNIDDGEW